MTDLLLDPAPSVHVLEVTGGRWTGKSTLLARLADEAEERGWRVAVGRAAVQPSSARPPFGLFLGVMDDLLTRGGVETREEGQEEWARRAFDGLLGLGEGTAELRDDPVLRYQNFRTVRGLLEEAASSRGLLLVLDDVHWADEGSLELLEHLVRHPPRGTVLLALAHRPRQSSLQLHTVLNEVVRDGQARRVAPPRLSAEEAGALLPEDISRVQSSLLLEESDHNPGLLKAFAAMRLPLHPQWPSRTNLPVEALAEVLRDFHALSPLGWRVARAAAILDEPFSLNVLQAVSQVDDEELHTAIDELAGQDIFEADANARHLRFSNSLLRAAAHQSAGPGWLLGAHARAARLLARQRTDDVRLAEHLQFQIAGEDSRTSRLLLDAAAGHRWTDAMDACAWAETALTIGDSGGDEAWATTVLGSALALSGQLGRSLEVLQRVGGSAASHAHAVEALLWTAWARRMLGEADVAERELATAVRSAPGLGPVERAELLADWVSCTLHLDRPVPAEPVAELLGLVEALPTGEQVRVHALSAMAGLRESGGTVARARAQTEAAARLLAPLRDDDLVEHLDGLIWLARAEAELKRPEVAIGHLERGLSMAEGRRFHSVVPLFAGALARVESGVGDPHGAVRHASVAVAAARRTDSPYLRERSEGIHAALASGPGRSGIGRFTVLGGEVAAADALDVLSKRELQIAVLVSNGRTNSQIARALVVSQKTVETHLGRIFKKLAVASRAEVAACVGRSYDHRDPLSRTGVDARTGLSSRAVS
ncbi:LuxR C-terminal-related transcriptional regulator [Streptomyces dangxiongensis]|uniref:LuxR C-terminal-related transcriptional regulator n=1 Tax=Streptomyces dangxiongensis TaxID=1442032 RepID=UPI0013CE4F41|nr:LuxR family transcriptional regulator [Streptomyces dangxiongensis]